MAGGSGTSTGSGTGTGGTGSGFVPPPYPFSRLGALERAAAAHDGGVVDLSIGTPCDPPPAAVVEALASSGSERGYPPASGSTALREATAAWIGRRLGAEVAPSDVFACVGTKEFVSSVPQWLRLRSPARDTVLYPAVSYPTYEMGAILAGCRAVRVAMGAGGSLDLASISDDDAARALCLWVNSPGNPAGRLDDLPAAATWGRSHGVPVFSDECYAEFTWAGRARTILEAGTEGVVAVHSLSKRSNLAGMRVGSYSGDSELVTYLAEVRRHAGMMVPGPAQAAAVVALGDDSHVDAQREIYLSRLELLADTLRAAGIDAEMPAGSFYLWVAAPAGIEQPAGETPGWALARFLAERAGVLASPGELYGPGGDAFTRLAVVQPHERLELVAKRLAGTSISAG
jgi:aspartate/methionine/tyrosine aminotransferase